MKSFIQFFIELYAISANVCTNHAVVFAAISEGIPLGQMTNFLTAKTMEGAQ